MLDLQIAWFLLVGVLIAGYAILDGFDLGVGTLHLFLARDDRERRVLLNSIGPVWDGNEVWILTGGGALFAAFPPVYATVFSGFYLALMVVLFALVVRAVSLEFRSKEESLAWRSAWDVAFSVSSFLAALLFGVAIGNIMRGLPLDQAGEYAGTFFTLLNPFALAVGLLSVAMFAMQGAAWLCTKTEGALLDRARAVARGSWMAFLGLWVLVTAYSYVAVPRLWRAYGSPLAMIIPVFLLVAVAVFPILLGLKEHRGAFLASSATIAFLIAIMGQGLFPDLVPALNAPTLSLTIRNASSSPLTLKTMLVIALVGMPAVLGYTVFIYSRFKGPVVLDDNSY